MRRLLPFLLTLAGCGLLPAPTNPDGGIAVVPPSYHRAMQTGGHSKHVGATQPDGGTVACRACHDVDRDGFANPSLSTCASCHETEGGFHHGNDARLPDGGAVTCLSCHPFWVREGPLPNTNWVCLDCHQEPMGTKRAARVHDTACFFCHRPHQTPFTKPTDCTVCHDGIGLLHGASGPTVAATCMTCHEQHTRAVEATGACLECHSDAKRQKRASHVVTAQAIFEGGHEGCGSCHAPHRFAKADVKACESCHENHPVLARGVTPKAHAACTDCHQPHAAKAPPKACESCHRDVKPTHPVTAGAPGCLGCHPIHEKLPPATVARECRDCHDAPHLTGVVHAEKDARGRPMQCTSCHRPHAFDLGHGSQASCRACHQDKLAATAKVNKSGHATCANCHTGLPHKPAPEQKACGECHTDRPTTGTGHVKCLDCHEPHSGSVEKTCTSCHEPDGLEGLHAVSRHQTCETCHQAHGQKKGFQRETCRSCHTDMKQHEPNAQRCTGCHLFREASTAPGKPP